MRKTLLSTTGAAALGLSLFAGTPSAMATTTTPAHYGYTSAGDFSSVVIPIDLFDSSLGTLTSVIVTQSLSVDYTANPGMVSFIGSGSATPTATATTQLTFTSGPTLLNGPPSISVTVSQPTILSDGTPSVAFNPSFTQGNPAVYISTSLSNWQVNGGGTDDLSVTATSTPGGPGYGTVFDLTWGSNSPGITYDLWISYEYTTGTTDTPEPASLLTLGAALVGLGALKGRQRLRPRPPEASG